VEVLPVPRLPDGGKIDALIARHMIAADPTVGHFVVRLCVCV